MKTDRGNTYKSYYKNTCPKEKWCWLLGIYASITALLILVSIASVQAQCPVSPAIAGPSSVCANSAGTVYKTETGKSSYSWAVVGGTITSGNGTDLVTVTWGSTGSGKISVRYFDPVQNCTTQPTNYNVAVNQLPEAFTVTGGGSYCSGGSGVVIGLGDSENGVSYQLKNGAANIGGQVAGTGGAISFGAHTAGGTYTVVATNSATGCSQTMTGSAAVIVYPSPSVAVNSPAYCTNGSPPTITATPNPAGSYSYVWSVPSGVTNPGNVSSFAATVSGNYNVDITNSNGCTASATGSLTVSDPPQITLHPISQTVCQGGTLYFVAGATGAVTYQWQVNPGNGWSNLVDGDGTGSSIISGVTTNTLAIRSTSRSFNDQQVRVVVTNSLGCVSISNAATISVSGPLWIEVDPQPIVVCSGQGHEATFIAEAQGSQPITAQWQYSCNGFGGPWNDIPGATATTTNGNGAGHFWTNYTFSDPSLSGCLFRVNFSNVCGSSPTGAATYTVLPPPTASITGGGSACAGAAAIVTISGTPNTIVTYTINGGVNRTIQLNSAGLATINATSSSVYSLVSVQYATEPSCPNAVSGSVSVTINPLPLAPAGAGNSICGSGPVSLSANACPGGILKWYDVAGGGAPLGGGTVFTTPAISTSTTYYVSCTDNLGCESVRTPVVATVNPIPAAPTGVGASRCETGTVNLGASGCAGTLKWYDAAFGGIQVGTGASFTTPVINTTTSYWVSCTSAAGCEGPRTEVIATVNAFPSAPTGIGASRCGAGTVVLSASGCTGGTFKWYTAVSGGSSIGTGLTYTTPGISSNTLYYVSCTVNGCEGPRASAVATINPVPGAPAGISASRCGPGTVDLAASTCPGGTLTWYAASTGSTALDIGSPFTTPSISASTTYYVSCTDNLGCESPRASVLATVKPIPVVTAGNNGPLCEGEILNLTATSTPSAGASFSWTGPNGFNSSRPSTSISNVPATATGAYTVTATANGCTSDPATTDVVINPLTPPIAIHVSRCGAGSVTLDVTGCSGGTINWYVNPNGGQPLFTGSSFTTPNLSSTTTYYVSCITGNCVSPRTPVTATINPLPLLTITNPAALCSPATVNLSAPAVTTNSALQGGIFTYWKDAAATDPLFNPTSLGASGIYYIKATTPAGCTDIKPVAVSISNPATLITGGPDAVCQASTPSPITLIGAGVGGGATMAAWSISSGGGGLSSTAQTNDPATVAYTPAPSFSGTITLTLTSNVPGACPAVSATRTININPLPACFITGADNVCPGTTNIYSAPAGPGTYQWAISGNGAISGSTTSSTVMVVAGSSCGPYTLTLAFTNVNNCTSTCSQTFNAIDTTAPVWLTKAGALDRIVECTDAAGVLAAQALSPTATDNCSDVTYNKISGVFAGNACGGIYTNTWVAKDQCNNTSAEFTQVIRINPPAIPTMTPLPDITVACGALPASSTLVYTNSLTGSCLLSGVSNPSTFTAMPSACGGTVIETWTARDACGRALASVSRTITVLPADLPTMLPPEGLTIDCGASLTPSTLPYNNGQSRVCQLSGTSNPSTFSPLPGVCGGTVTETWTATDACGRILQPVSRTLTVLPAPPPEFITPPSDVTVACDAIPSIPVVGYSNGSRDACLISGMVTAQRSGAITGCGSTLTDSWTFTDACGRTIQGSRTIAVLPAPAPILIMPFLPSTLSCTDAASFTSAPDAAYSNYATGSCLISGTIKAVITPAYTPCAGGIISVKYEAADGCGNALNKTITISVSPCRPAAVELIPAAATCKQDNGMLLIGAITGGTAPYSYSVDGKAYLSATHLTDLSDGVHTVKVRDANGCVFTATTTIGRQALILSSDFSAQGCSSYTLPWGEVATQSSDYQHTYQSVGGCDSVVTAHILIKKPSASLASVTICSSQLPYIWNRKRYYLPGTYAFKTVNAEGCDSVASLRLMINQPTNGPTDSISVCSNALPFHWNGLSVNQAGRYTAIFQNRAGCDSIVQLVFVTSPMATAKVTGDNPICSGSTNLTLHLTGIAPWTVVYTDGAVKDTIHNITASPYVLTVSPTQTTTYSLLSVYDVECSNTTLTSSVTVNVVPPPPGVRYPDVMASANVPKELQARDFGSAAMYLWDPSIGLNINTVISPVFRYDSTVQYTIIISAVNGCRIVDTLRVLVPVSAPAILSDIFVPKAWSPNKDTHNDALQPLCVNIKEIYYFRIFNRWGQLMFETREKDKGWNGIFKGMPQVQDVYTWTLEATGEDGKYYKRSGTSILLR